ncbi:MAG: SDR family NAD(P)-dependent oxidoreductase [Candidatus Poseidoniales archaeon]|nr:MAG: SDR family NAD(P)-dependent oxidoreductase [Candidatus Poseidoniales archaeon]
MSSRRILVTGGAGFIGSSLCERLVEDGHIVLAYDSLFRGTETNIQSIRDHPNFQFMLGDVRDIDRLDDAVEALGGVDIVFHLAAVNGTKWFHEAAHSVIDVNINGTLRTLELAMAHEARYVLASSPEAFGEAKQQPIQNGNEMTFTDPSLHQRHSYGASKYLDEIACQHAVREGLDVRIVRPFNAYGPRLLGDEYGQVVAMFFNAILNNQPIEIHNGGEQTRSFTWIADIVDGFYRAGIMDMSLDGSSLSGTALNIGSTEEVSILALQEQMFSLVKASSWARPMPEVRYTEGYHGDAKRRLPDCSISENLIGWKPQTNLIQGLSAMWNQLS